MCQTDTKMVSYRWDGDVREILLPEIVELGPADYTAGIAGHLLRHPLIDPLHGK